MTRFRLNAFLPVSFLLLLATMACGDAHDDSPAPSTDSEVTGSESTGSTPTENGSCDEGGKLCSLSSIDQSWCCDTDLACGESHNRCVAVYGTPGCEDEEIECVRPGLDDGLIQYVCCQAGQLCTADGCEDPPPATLHDSATEDQCVSFDNGLWCRGPTKALGTCCDESSEFCSGFSACNACAEFAVDSGAELIRGQEQRFSFEKRTTSQEFSATFTDPGSFSAGEASASIDAGEVHIIPSCDSGQEDTEEVVCVEGIALQGGCIGERVAVTWNCAWTTDESASLTITASRYNSDVCEMATVLFD